MVNQWIMFLRQYSKDNNISYSCAITEAAPSYRKMKEEMKNKEEEPKIFSKKVKKQKQKKLKEEEEKEDEEEEENPDIISNELQRLLFVSGNEKIKNALIKLNFKGRLQTNPIMRNMQVLQNFNSVKKMKELIKELKGMK